MVKLGDSAKVLSFEGRISLNFVPARAERSVDLRERGMDTK